MCHFGDFNLPTLNWAVDVSSNNLLLNNRKILNYCGPFLMQSSITSGNILDLLLTTEPYMLGSLEVLPTLPSCSYSPVVIDIVYIGEMRDGGAAASGR